MPSNFSTRHVSKQSKTFPLGIVVISILFLSFLLWSKWDRISQFFGNTSLNTSINDAGFTVGESISLEGQIRQDGDFITHTHTLLTQSSWVFGLKSKNINLNQYSGAISLEWVIDSQHSGLVIIQVTSVMDLNPISPIVESWTLNTGAQLTGQISPIVTGTSQSPVTATSPTTVSAPIAGSKIPLSVQAGVEQVPITIGTGTLFTSSRGHNILFPSKKISFQSVTIAPIDFGIKGLRCYTQMNVVAYLNKAQVATAPAVKIYECTNKTNSFPSQFGSILLDDGRVFLIEATDPAWWDFANAIEITTVATTN